MNLEENRPSPPSPKVLLQNNVSVIQIFVFTIAFSFLFINNSEMKKYPGSRVWALPCLMFFVIFTPTVVTTIEMKCGWEWISNLTSYRNHYWNNDHYWNNYFNKFENAFQTFIFIYIFPLTTISFIIIYSDYNNYIPSNSFKFQCISHL